jgi:hypothetical protein
MFSPPPGYVDCEADAEIDQERRGESASKFHEIEVPDVGIIHARRPLPNAIPAIANAANAKISAQSRLDYLDIFIQNHLAPGEFEQLLARMMDPDGDMPADTMLRVSRAIATAGTARPT